MRPSHLAALVLVMAAPVSARAAAPATPLVVFYAAPELGEATRAPVRGALDGAAQRIGSAMVDLSAPAEPVVEASLHLRRAIEAYQDFRYGEALASAEAGMAEAAATGGLGLSDTDLSDLLIYRALALTERGDSARAWDDFIRAATVDPSRRLDPVRYPPRVIETFTRAVKAVAAAPPAALVVELPPGCELWLDGRSVTGQKSLSTSRGEHYVRTRCAQRAPYGARILVASDEHRLAPELPALVPPDEPAIRAAARQRGFGSALSATLGRGGPGGQLILTLRSIDAPGERPRGMVVLRLARPDSTAGIEAALNRLLAPPPVTVAAGARGAGRERPTPWYRRPWLWGLAGAAVAAAVLVPFALDSRTPSDFDIEFGGRVPP